MSEVARYAVDLELLSTTIASLAAGEVACEEALEEVRRDVAQLHLTWSGRAADAQVGAQQRWESGFARMQDGLAAMRAAAATSHGNYRAAVEANLAMWGSL